MVKTVTVEPVRVVVYHDAQGRPFSTETVLNTVVTPTSEIEQEVDQEAPSSATVTAVTSSAPVQEENQYRSPSAEEPAADSSPSSDEQPSPPASSSSPPAEQSSPPVSPPATAGGSGNGVTYTPYTDDGQCKSADEVNRDFDQLTGFSVVRVYGTDCGHLDNVVGAARKRGIKLFLGIPKEKANAGGVGGEVEKIAEALGNDWDVIDTIAVGNEFVNGGGSPGEVASAVQAARTALKGKGYGGPVVAPDTFVAIIANPALCQHSDYMATNLHPFFDGKVSAAEAGQFLTDQAKRVSDACDGKKVVITETGWPNNGGTNGAAVPSKENQQKALSSIKDACGSAGLPYYLFSAFDEGWKKDTPNTLGCEKFWGIM